MLLAQHIKIKGLHLSVMKNIIYLVTVTYELSNLVGKYSAMARCLKSPVYQLALCYNSSPIVY